MARREFQVKLRRVTAKDDEGNELAPVIKADVPPGITGQLENGPDGDVANDGAVFVVDGTAKENARAARALRGWSKLSADEKDAAHASGAYEPPDDDDDEEEDEEEDAAPERSSPETPATASPGPSAPTAARIAGEPGVTSGDVATGPTGGGGTSDPGGRSSGSRR